jgi:hypothetical protein
VSGGGECASAASPVDKDSGATCRIRSDISQRAIHHPLDTRRPSEGLFSLFGNGLRLARGASCGVAAVLHCDEFASQRKGEAPAEKLTEELRQEL